MTTGEVITGELPSVQLSGPVFQGRARWTDLAALVGGPGPLAAVLTTFEPGAGTAWHTHEFAQVLVVTAGTGRLERPDGSVRLLGVGEAAVVAAGVVHRHAADGEVAMTHVSLSVPGDLQLSE
ncbi:cupin domain-containing protein [Kineococcus sp. SYSU DK003]|uniref:cupin domain-containing protein n=1 Tax=Kineococcus sp. SYSU DK003 TaxID=3383124 RepID=UPI003D7DFA01